MQYGNITIRRSFVACWNFSRQEFTAAQMLTWLA